MSAADTAEQTKVAWDAFNRLSDKELENLLHVAGIVPMRDRGMILHQVLMVWFHGSIPNLNEVTRLAEELVFGVATGVRSRE
jgi:hypothetical protein